MIDTTETVFTALEESEKLTVFTTFPD